MRKVKSADAAAGIHGETLSEPNPRAALDIENLPNRLLFGVVGLGGISGGWANAAVAFANQVFVGEIFRSSEAPELARLSMQALGKRLRKAVAQSLGHDGEVVVVAAFESRRDLMNFLTRRDGKGADVINPAAVARRHEIRKREVGLIGRLFHLLPQTVEDRQR